MFPIPYLGPSAAWPFELTDIAAIQTREHLGSRWKPSRISFEKSGKNATAHTQLTKMSAEFYGFFSKVT